LLGANLIVLIFGITDNV